MALKKPEKNWKPTNFMEVNKMYVISDACVSCGACAAGCPAEAISEGKEHMEINKDVCLECGACQATCPVGAITEE